MISSADTKDNQGIINCDKEHDNSVKDYEHVSCVIEALPNDLSEKQRQTASALTKENEALFSKSEFDIGHTSLSHTRLTLELIALSNNSYVDTQLDSYRL